MKLFFFLFVECQAIVVLQYLLPAWQYLLYQVCSICTTIHFVLNTIVIVAKLAAIAPVIFMESAYPNSPLLYNNIPDGT